MAAFPSIAHWVFIPFVVNASGAVGDLWLTRNVLRFPKHVLMEDKTSGLIIYGKETDKPMNISTTGFGQRFFKAFIVCIFAGGFLMAIAPIPLAMLGVKSFTIGPANSFFKIFEFHSSGECFEVGFFPMSLFATSVIAGLVYAIIKTGKPGVRPRKNPKKFDGKYPERRFMGLCIGIGLAFGAGIGVAMDNYEGGEIKRPTETSPLTSEVYQTTDNLTEEPLAIKIPDQLTEVKKLIVQIALKNRTVQEMLRGKEIKIRSVSMVSGGETDEYGKEISYDLPGVQIYIGNKDWTSIIEIILLVDLKERKVVRILKNTFIKPTLPVALTEDEK
jgi:hypothetical protein